MSSIRRGKSRSRTRKKTSSYNTTGPSNWPAVGKPTMYSPMSAIPTQRDQRLWEASVQKIRSMPIFYISCHASIIMSMPTFKIPKSVFILNTTSGGEFCMGGSELDRSIYDHRKHLHKLLIIDDIRDIPTEPMDARLRYQSIKKIKYKQPFLSKFKRATDCEYPNFLCTFEELGSDDLGVYNITTKNFPFVNKNSLIIDREIIHKIRSKNAIYIFAGCST